MNMTIIQSIITVLFVVLGTMLTRFLPFLLFPDSKTPPEGIKFLGKVLPYAVMGLLIVFSLKDVSITAGSHGIPEAIAIIFIIIIHILKRNTLLSIAGGTILYMILVQAVFK